MKLILFPNPDYLKAGPKHWRPAPGLIESLNNIKVSDRPDSIEFIQDHISQGAYCLHTSEGGIRIKSGDTEGRWNALMTLRQIILQTNESGELPELEIRDAPIFPIRGVMLDVSRTRVPKLDTLWNLIDLWASFKVNQIQLYTEHTFAYAGHETVWQDSSPYTGEDIQAIDAYCRERGIELVPNQNSFGHMERWFRHPEYLRYSESPGGFEDQWGVFREVPTTLDLSKNESIEFLQDLYDQLLPHFSSRRFNIGGDEPFDLGLGTNSQRYEKEGSGVVYLEFLRRILDDVGSRGRIPQFWADIILHYPELLSQIPENVEVMNWGYEAEHPFESETTLLAESGRTFYVCPGTSSWNSLTGRWTNARDNIRSAAHWGALRGAAGMLTTDWGDNGHKQQYVVSLPGWLTGAAAAWNGAAGADEDVQSALQVHVFGNSRGREAEWLLKLGDLYLENPTKLSNQSFLTLPLMDHDFPYARPQYPKIARGGIGRARDIAEEAASVLKELSGDTWRDQLDFTLRMALFTADLAEPFYSAKEFKVENITPELRRSLADRLEILMDDYSKLWHSNCRSGGLAESLGGFSGLLELLRTGQPRGNKI